MATSMQAFRVGETVAVKYDPSDPTIAEVDSFATLWGLVLLRSGFGAVFLIMGLATLVFLREVG